MLDTLISVVIIVMIGTSLANGTLQNADPLLGSLVLIGDALLIVLGVKLFSPKSKA